jgi:hypothetical protein
VGGLSGAPLVRPLHRIRPGVLLLAVCLLEVPAFGLMAAGIPAGYPAAGFLLQSLPARAALLVMAGILALSVLCGAARRELWRARWPQ